ncbi:MAG: hypothetical protein AB8B91_06360 [Rubripirellula sp.]
MSSTAPHTTAAPKLPWLRFGRMRTNCIGIDIGIDRVRIATFGVPRGVASSEVSGFRWLAQSEFSLPVDPSLPPQPEWLDVIAKGLRNQLPRCIDGETSVAMVSLPLPWIHYQTMAIADQQATQDQCDAMFSQSIFQSKAFITQWPIATVKEQMAAAVAESAACRIAEAISGVGYRVNGVLPHGAALLNQAKALTSIAPQAALMLEFSGGVVAIRNEAGACGLCRNLPACSLPVGESLSRSEIEPWLQEIAQEFDATSRYWSRLSGIRNQEEPVMICGSVAQIDGIDTALASLLGRPVATWRYAGRTRPRTLASSPDPIRCDPSLAVSLSLACAAIASSKVPRRRK